MRRSVLVAAALLAALIGLTAVSAVQLDASSAATRRSALRRHAASLDAAALGSPESIDQLVALADNVLNAGVDHAAAVSMPTPAPEAAYPAPQLDAATAAAEAQNAAVTAAASEPSDQESDQVEFNNDGSDFDFSADMPHEEPAQTEAAAAPKPVRHRSQHRNAHVHHKARFQSGSTSSSSRAPPMPTTQQAPAVAVPAALNVSRASNASVPSNATGASNATRPSNATVPSNATRPANATGSNATVPSNATRPANGSTSGNATVILERPAAPKPAPKPNPYAYIDEQIRALDQEQAKWTSDTQRPSEVALRQAPGGLFALNLTTTTVADPSIRLNLPKEFILPNSTGVEAGGQAPAGSVLKTFNVIESQVLPTPYPSQQELTSGEPVKFETFVKSKGNRADTTRQAMGRPNREDTFPTPYDLFTRFDYDRKGELNYREFNDLIEYVHNDFRNPKARRMASYRVIIGTSQAVNISHDVYVTFLGPSGQRSREYLLNKGPFNASYVVLRVEAEDVWFVTRARLRLVYPDGVSPPANDTEAWTVRSFAVQLHGRLTQALQPFTVRQAKHIALRPGKLRLDDSPSAQALGGDVNDQWTQRHYQEYLKKTAEYKAWVEQHMQEQRVYNFGLYNNVTNPVVVNTTAAINGTVDSNSTASSNTTANATTESNSTTNANASTPVANSTATNATEVPVVANTTQPAATNNTTAPNATTTQPAPTVAAAPSNGSVHPYLEGGAPANRPQLTGAVSSVNPLVKLAAQFTRPVQEPLQLPSDEAARQAAAEALKQSMLPSAPASASTGVTPIVEQNAVNETQRLAANAAAAAAAAEAAQRELNAQRQAAIDKAEADKAAELKAAQNAAKWRAVDSGAAELAAIRGKAAAKPMSADTVALLNKMAEQEKERQLKAQDEADAIYLKSEKMADTKSLWFGREKNVGLPGYYISDHDIPEKVLPAPWAHMTEAQRRQWLELSHIPEESHGAYGGHGVARVPGNVAGAHYPGEGLVPLPEDQTYDYKQNGRDWLGTCRDGKRQSPIMLDARAARKSSGLLKPGDTALALNYATAPAIKALKIVHTGHFLKIAAHGLLGSVTSGVNNDVYPVKSLIFRAPSEHGGEGASRADGLWDMEMQIFHQKNGSVGLEDLLVISVPFRAGNFANNTFLESLDWNYLPHTAGHHRVISNEVTLRNATGSSNWQSPYFSYFGSITFPPCAETVSWRVLQQPVDMSLYQLRLINALFSENPKFSEGKGNNRAFQRFNGGMGGLTISG